MIEEKDLDSVHKVVRFCYYAFHEKSPEYPGFSVLIMFWHDFFLCFGKNYSAGVAITQGKYSGSALS